MDVAGLQSRFAIHAQDSMSHCCAFYCLNMQNESSCFFQTPTYVVQSVYKVSGGYLVRLGYIHACIHLLPSLHG